MSEENAISEIPQAPTPTVQLPVAVKSLDDLVKACDKTFDVTVFIDGQGYSIPCRRLTPAESAQIALIIDEVLPAQQVAQDGNEPQFAIDKATRAKMQEANRDAIAMTVYLGCPMYHEKKPGLKSRTEIREFVNSMLSEQVLQAIYEAIIAGNISLQAHVNFT